MLMNYIYMFLNIRIHRSSNWHLSVIYIFIYWSFQECRFDKNIIYDRYAAITCSVIRYRVRNSSLIFLLCQLILFISFKQHNIPLRIWPKWEKRMVYWFSGFRLFPIDRRRSQTKTSSRENLLRTNRWF